MPVYSSATANGRKRKDEVGRMKDERAYSWESPESDLAEARRLIEECGYWRRKGELEDVETVILGRPGRSML